MASVGLERPFTTALGSPEQVHRLLGDVGYVTDLAISTTISIAALLEKPILVEGPPGTGKTQLATSLARAVGTELIRLQCYEGMDESRVLFEWDYGKQLLAVQSSDTRGTSDVFTEEFLIARPVLAALTADAPPVLLLDEIDQLDHAAEALLLEALAEYQVTIPELGTIRAAAPPFTILTSGGSRELTDALKRRCLYLHIDYPSPEKERAIIRARVSNVSELLADQIAEAVGLLRSMKLKKHPSISETLDWARILVHGGREALDPHDLRNHLQVLLKNQSDIELVASELA